MPKRIWSIKAGGPDTLLDTMPDFKTMQSYVGGYIELVKVLRPDATTIEPDSLTYMIVNEDGRTRGLPYNKPATVLYQGLVRAQFPQAANPFAAAHAAWRATLPPDMHVLETADPTEEPWIAGDVLYFEGYSCAELERLWNAEDA